LERILGKWEGGSCGLGSTGSGYELVSGSCENGIEISDSLKDGQCIDSLSDSQLLKKVYVQWINYRIIACPV